MGMMGFVGPIEIVASSQVMIINIGNEKKGSLSGYTYSDCSFSASQSATRHSWIKWLNIGRDTNFHMRLKAFKQRSEWKSSIVPLEAV
jgi:hypothetical protein